MNKKLIILIFCLVQSLMILAIPNTMTYQGRLWRFDSEGEKVPVNGTVQMTVRLYNNPVSVEPQSLLWSSANITVDVSGGLYRVMLGDSTNPITPEVFNNDNVYIDVQINGEDFSRRTPVTSVGYAFQAAGLSSAEVVTINTGSHVAVKGDIISDGEVYAVKYYGDGSGLTNLPAPSLRAYGAANDAPDSSAYIDSAGNMGIGTNSPTARLSVSGNAEISGKVTASVVDANNLMMLVPEQIGYSETSDFTNWGEEL